MAQAGKPLDIWQQDGMDIMLGLRADGKWSCFEYAEWVSRQNGKGVLGEARVMAGMFLLDEKLMLWSAHEYKTAMEAFRRVTDLCRVLGEQVSDNMIHIPDADPVSGEERLIRIKITNSSGEQQLERLDTRQRIKFIARSRGSGRGFSGDLNVLDESFALTDDQVAALMPTVSARPNPQLVYLSSPPLTGDTGGPMYLLRRRAKAGGDDSLGYRDWGLDGDLANLRDERCVKTATHVENCSCVDLDSEASTLAANPAMLMPRPSITLETTRRERRSMGMLEYARERLGIWPPDLSSGYGVISKELWDKARDRSAVMLTGTRPAFALDVAPDRTTATISAAGPCGDDQMLVQVLATGSGTGWVVNALRQLKKNHDPCVIIVDPGGPAGSLMADLELAGLAPEKVGAREVAQAFGMFYDAVAGADTDARNLRHLGQAELDAAVAGAGKRQVGDGHAWDRRNATVDITPVVSATNALRGYAVHGHVETVAPWSFYG